MLRCGERCPGTRQAERDVKSGLETEKGGRGGMRLAPVGARWRKCPRVPMGTTRREGPWAPPCPDQGAPLHPHAAPSSQGWGT